MFKQETPQPWASVPQAILLGGLLAGALAVRLHAAQTTYEFQNSRLGTGELFDQDNWQARLGSWGASVVTGLGWNSSRGLEGGPREAIYSRANDANFSFAVTGSETAAVFEFDAKIGEGAVLLGVGANLDDTAPHSEYGFEFGLDGLLPIVGQAGLGGYVDGKLPDVPTYPGDWIRVRLTVNFGANGGDGTAEFAWQNLSRGMASFVEIKFDDDLNLGLNAMPPSARPRYWNTLFIRVGPGTALDRIVVPSPSVPVIAAPASLPDGIAFEPYQQPFTVIGEGWAPFLATRVVRGRLPAGLAVTGTSPFDTRLSGLPTEWGDYEFTVEMRGGAGGLSQRTLRLHVGEPRPNCLPWTCGLAAWWKAERDGANALSGQANWAQLKNGAGFGLGRVGDAFLFDNPWAWNSTFTVQRAALVEPAIIPRGGTHALTALTIEGWIWITPRPEAEEQGGVIVGWYRNVNGSVWRLETKAGRVNGQPRFALAFSVMGENENERQARSGWLITPDRWVHVAASFNSANQEMRLFIDGAETPVVAPTTSPLPIDLIAAPPSGPNAVAPLVIGAAYAGFSVPGFERKFTQGFNGGIDELAIHTEALGPEQVAAVFVAGSQGRCPWVNDPLRQLEVTLDEDTPTSFRLESTASNATTLIPSLPQFFNGTGPTYVFSPSEDFHGDVTHYFQAQDCLGRVTSRAEVTFHVLSVNDRPVARGQILHTLEDISEEFRLLATDADADRLTYCLAAGPSNGRLTQNGQPISYPCALTSPTLVYHPNPEFHGTDRLGFKVNDGTVDSDVVAVDIIVDNVDDPPEPVTLELTVDEDSYRILPRGGIDLMEHDTVNYAFDPGLETPLGRVDWDYNLSAFVYRPKLNVNGRDSIPFLIQDDARNSTPGTANIDINPVNDPPTTFRQSLNVGEDQSLAITLTAEDIDRPPDRLTFKLKSPPSHGNLDPDVRADGTLPGSFHYRPLRDYHGDDSFDFVAFDDREESQVWTVSIQVNHLNDDPPEADNIDLTVAEDSRDNPVRIIAGNHARHGPDGRGIWIQWPGDSPWPTAHGGIVRRQDSQGIWDAWYTPNANYTGVDSFTYTVSDGSGNEAIGTVTVTVRPSDDLPTAQDFVFTRTQGSVVSWSVPPQDVDGERLTYTVSSGPDAVNTVVVRDGTFTYTPGPDFIGLDRFTYTVTDGRSPVSAEVRFRILPLFGQAWLAEEVSQVPEAFRNGGVRMTGFGYQANQSPNGDWATIGWDYFSEAAMTHWAWKDGTTWHHQEFYAGFSWPGGGQSQDNEAFIPGFWPQFLLRGVWQFSGSSDGSIRLSDEYTWRVTLPEPTSFRTPEPLEEVRDHTGSQGVRQYLPGQHGGWLTWRSLDGHGDSITINGSSLFEGTFDMGGVGFDTDPSGGPHVLQILEPSAAGYSLYYSQGRPGSGFGRPVAQLDLPRYAQAFNRVDLRRGLGHQLHAVIRASTKADSPMIWGAGHLHYLTSVDGVEWAETSLDDSTSVQVAAIAIDPMGRPAVAYVRNENEIRFAMLLNGQWRNESVRPIDWNEGDDLEISFDERGLPGIGFYDRCSHAIRVARPTGDPNLPVDLAVSSAPASLDVTAGETAQAVITVVNTAPRVATQVSVSVTLPEHLTIVSSTPPSISIAGQTLHYEVGALAACPATIRLTVRPVQPGSFDVAAAATSAERDEDPSNNETYCHIESGEAPRPEFAPGASPPGGLAGLDYSFQFTATSLNGACSFGVSEGALPAGLMLSRDGFLRGRPVLTDTNGVSTHTFTVRATDPAGRTATAPVTLRVQVFTGLAYTWTGAADSNWSNPANWSPRGVPGANDTATLANGTTVTLPGDIRLLELSLQNATLTGPATFSGNLLWTGGAMIDANLTLAAGSVLRLAGGADRVMIRTVLRNQGTVEWEGGTLTLNSSSIENAGRWDVRGDVALVQQNDCSFANSGLYLRNAGSGTHSVALTSFISTGQIEARAGTLAFPIGNVVSRGANNHVSAALEAQVSFAGNNRFEATAFDGPGPKVLNAGSFSWTGTMRLENVSFAGGVLTGAAVIEGSLPWTGGELIDLDLTIPAGHTLHLAGGADRRLVRSILRNRGAVAWDGGTLTLNSSTVENANLWDVRGDLALVQQNDCAFLNTGRYLRSAGTGSHTIALTTFSNSTTVECRTGGLSFPVGNVLSRGESNRFLVDDGARLDFAGNNRFEATAFEGSGPKVFNAGAFAWINTRTLENVTFAGGVLTGTVTLGGPLRWTGGELIDLDLTVPPGLELHLAGGADRRLVRTVLRNHGAITWEGGTLTLNSSHVDNYGLWDVQGDLLLAQQNDCSFVNLGHYVRSRGPGTHTIALTAFHTGTQVVVLTGTLAFPAGNVLSRLEGNRFVIAEGARVDFAGNNYFEGTSFEGPGLKVLSAGSFSWLGTMSLENVTFAGGVLTGQAVLDGPLHWTGGEFIDLDLTVPVGETLRLAGGADRRLVRTALHNQGAVEWHGGTLTLNSSTIENLGLWEVQADVALVQQNDCAFLNTGRYLRSGGGGSHTIALTTFNNSTAVENRTGNLLFPSGNVVSRGETNRFTMATDTRLDFAGNNFFEATHFEGPGLTVFNSGSFRWVGTMGLRNATLAGGVLTGNATLNGPLRWTGGELIDLDLTVPAGQTLQLAGDADRRLVRTALHNQGTVEWQGGTLTLNSSTVENRGLWEVQADVALVQQNDCAFLNNGRYLRSGGSGTHTVALSQFAQNGTLDLQQGIAALQAGYSLAPTAVLRFGFGGLAPGAGYAQLQFSGAVSLAGKLEVELRNGFVPAKGNVFTPIIFGSSIGTLSGVGDPAGMPGSLFKALYEPAQLRLLAEWATPLSLGALGIAGGAFEFAITGTPGQSFAVETSTNLTAWGVLTNLTLQAPVESFFQPGAGSEPQRFFRLRPTP